MMMRPTMMRATIALPAAAFLLAAQAAPAQTPMSPDEFDAWSSGKTLDYAVGGQVYGSESYFPDRRVLDADVGGPCLDGSWHAEGDAVCFVYPARDGTHCWLYWREGDTVLAKPLNAAPEDPAQTVTEAKSPLSCPGPDVGV